MRRMNTENQVISSWHQQITRKPVKTQDSPRLGQTKVLGSNNAICNSAQINLPAKKNLSAKSISNTRNKGLTQHAGVRTDTNKPPKKNPPSDNTKKTTPSHEAQVGENNKENIDPNAQALANLSLKSSSNSPKGSPKLKRDAKSRLKRI